MKIVVTDGYTLNPGDNPWTEVETLGDFTVYERSSPDEVLQRCDGADILVVNKTVIDHDIISRLDGLKFITMAATGYDCVDIKYAGSRGIPVSNIPVYGTDTVAQYVFSAILHLAHNISDHAEAVRVGRWSTCSDWCFWDRPLMELKGATLGIVGFGRIGRRVGEIAHSFGMNILAYDLFTDNPPDYDRFAWSTIEALFQRSDIVTLHCPLTRDNQQFVNASLLSKMKPTAFLLNAARGGLVDEEALTSALVHGKIAGGVVDTVSAEPIRPDNPLLQAPNLFITPHLAWGTLAARKRLMAGVAENIASFLNGTPVNVVNEQFLS